LFEICGIPFPTLNVVGTRLCKEKTAAAFGWSDLWRLLPYSLLFCPKARTLSIWRTAKHGRVHPPRNVLVVILRDGDVIGFEQPFVGFVMHNI
jgi:hypothetical protein